MLERHSITSTCGYYTRDIWILPGPADSSHNLAVFLDGEFYLEKMNVAPLLEDAFNRGVIPPMTCVFVSYVSNVERHQDLVCNSRYSRFVCEDVIVLVRGKNSHIQGSENLLCGFSLSGLAAAYATVHNPTVFSKALCQSGSFWWLADNEVDMPSTCDRFWLSVGNEETETDVRHSPSGMHQRVSQIEGVETAVRRLEKLGGLVKSRVFQGGHSIDPWVEEIVPALTWLVGDAI